MNKGLGCRIKELREQRNLTQEQVASKLGISRQRYSHIEKGLNNVTLDLLNRLSDIFDVTISDITSVLDKGDDIAYYADESAKEVGNILEMIDFFYANKHLYQQLKETHR